MLEIVGTVIPSTEITPALTRAMVVSEACPSSIEPTPIAVEVEATRPAIGKPVQFVSVPEVGVPKIGVTKVGEVENTMLVLVVPVVPVADVR